MKQEVSKTSGVQRTQTTTRVGVENETQRRKSLGALKYNQQQQQQKPPKITPTTRVVVTQPPPPQPQQVALPPPKPLIIKALPAPPPQPPPPQITTIIAHMPPARANIGVNTDTTTKATIGTNVGDDLIKTQNRAVNTELRGDQLELRQKKPRKAYFFNECFWSYYDNVKLFSISI